MSAESSRPAPLRLGLDVGSTTAKAVLLDAADDVVFSAYRRHNADVLPTVRAILSEASQRLGDAPANVLVTGSAGLGVSERFQVGFVQEVIAAAEVVRRRHPEVRTLLDIGGEDAKMIFFEPGQPPDIRMNGACAGGTGAFVDQMSTLLGVTPEELDAMARRHRRVHPIAARCGVFAKTDVQNLLCREAAREDIAASVLYAVAWQTLATLGRGSDPKPAVLFAGGPLAFLPALRDAFIDVMHLCPRDVLQIDRPELLPALGAALSITPDPNHARSLSRLERLFAVGASSSVVEGRLPALFESDEEMVEWLSSRSQSRAERLPLEQLVGRTCFLGVDSGSTTTKLVLVDEAGRIAYERYLRNDGNPIQAVREGLEQLAHRCADFASPPRIARTVVTGYGEDLIRAAFGCDEGMVETLAHFRAARAFEPGVSFVLDIGGQDMKAIFVRDGRVGHIAINEACSSGCGTFIETFARSLGHEVADFAARACRARAPCDLGSRCTVFMNSKVKQALREGADVADIAAGLAYAVIKNALHKVLRIADPAVLGERIVVQGGAFRNAAIHRALERLLGRSVLCPDIAELMGAYGAALTARDTWRRAPATPGPGLCLDRAELRRAGTYRRRPIRCSGCRNACAVAQLTFANGNRYYTGNRCERVFSNAGHSAAKGYDFCARKLELLFDRPAEPPGEPRLTIGLPRGLNLYEDYPFWCTLLVQCGFRVRLSGPSTRELYEAGVGTVMSENICFPAKLMHGHIRDLTTAGVDRILYPMVFYGRREFVDASNTYNCPIVSGYADVVHSAVDPECADGIPLDRPSITFDDHHLLRQTCHAYLSSLGVGPSTIRRAVALAIEAQRQYGDQVRREGSHIMTEALRDGRRVIVLAGRPYHLDGLVNHSLPQLLADMGVDVVTEDSVPLEPTDALDDPYVLTQWMYVNRLYHAARWVARHDGVELVQVNSFGCGPDAVAVDEVGAILSEHGKQHTVIRIDEIDASGSVKLRLRSLLESLEAGGGPSPCRAAARRTTRWFEVPDRPKTILVPEFASFCTPPILRPLRDMGYRIEELPSSDTTSVDVGLRYANNEICYPGLIVIGDAIKALQSGNYDADEVVVGSWETGGQCRASSISCLLKKALVAAGFSDVPVVTLSTRMQPLNPQPGFKINARSYMHGAALGMVYCDALSALYHATAARELPRGAARALANRYLEAFDKGLVPLRRSALVESLGRAVEDFNAIPAQERALSRVGIVGEIYVKYNPFANHDVAQWLTDRGCEVHLPPLMTFFSASLVNRSNAVQARIQRRSVQSVLAPVFESHVQGFVRATDRVLEDFRYYRPRASIRDLAAAAREAVSLSHQYGEGWLLAGEVGHFARTGVSNILCLQPFGCIANHVVAKGIGRRLRQIHPGLNLLFLDLDASGNEVGALNRLHFFLQQARAGAS